MSFRTKLAADFKREYKNVEAKTRDRGRISLTSGGVRDTGKIPMLLGNEGDGEAARGPREPSLPLDEAEDFLVEMDVKELSLPVYDPNRGRLLHPRELYPLVHVIFSDTNIQVYLHKKYYLSIG